MGWTVTVTAIQGDTKFSAVTVAAEVKKREWLQVMLKKKNIQEPCDASLGWMSLQGGETGEV